MTFRYKLEVNDTFVYPKYRDHSIFIQLPLLENRFSYLIMVKPVTCCFRIMPIHPRLIACDDFFEETISSQILKMQLANFDMVFGLLECKQLGDPLKCTFHISRNCQFIVDCECESSADISQCLNDWL